MSVFRLPDLGEGLHEAEIVTWHVSPGDHVVTDQPLVSVETDKAIVEIPSPRSARVTRLIGEPGGRVPVGTPLVEFEEVGAGTDSGTVVGTLNTITDSAGPAQGRAPQLGRATPAVRALARTLDVDLSVVHGSGPQGVVTRADVERAAATLAGAAPAEPLRGVRRAMAERMSKAHAEVPRATVMDEADIAAWRQKTPVMVRAMRAVVAGCRAVPALNAWFDREKMTRRLHRRIDLGVAVEADDGLFVPVLRDVGSRSSDDLERGLHQLKEDVRNRTIRQADLRGQTITLSNFGTVGGMFAELVVVPPQVAIVGVGRRSEKVVLVDRQAVTHQVLPLSVTFDHRAVTGAEAAGFLRAIVSDLESAE